MSPVAVVAMLAAAADRMQYRSTVNGQSHGLKQRRVDLLVDDKELERRRAASKKSVEPPARGYARLYAQEILGADQGCDFAFLKPR